MVRNLIFKLRAKINFLKISNFLFRKLKIFFIVFLLIDNLNKVLSEINFTVSENGYECTAWGLTREKLDLLDPKTNSGISNSDVTVMVIHSLYMERIPSEIGEIFPNLKTIRIYNCHLNQVTSDDLKFMPNIETFMIQWCKNLTELSTLLFQYNKKLKEVFFFKNDNLYSIHHRTFDGLTNLEYLGLKRNRCINKGFKLNETSLRQIHDELAKSCSKSTYCFLNDNELFECSVENPGKSIEEF